MIILIEETPVVAADGSISHVLDLQFNTMDEFDDLPNANKPFNSTNYSTGYNYGVPATGSVATCIATSKTYSYTSGEWVETGSGSTKIWATIELSQSDIKTLSSDSELVKTFATPYTTSDFKNDYFLVRINDTGEREGTVLYAGESFSKVYVDLIHDTDYMLPYLYKHLDYAMNMYGFDYNYYKTAVLFAGCDEEYKELEGANLLEGRNIIFAQDVSQQAWETNPTDSKVAETIAREKLEQENFGFAYVISIHAGAAANDKAFLLCLNDSQAAYWDTTANATRWANIYAGKIYAVTFDATHDTLRWLLDGVEDDPESTDTSKKGIEMTTAAKEDLYNNGVTFAADKYAAYAFVDTAIKAKGECTGNGATELRYFFSWGDAFEEPETNYLEFIGRPYARTNQSYTYYYEGEEVVEKKGLYAWNAVIDNDTVSLIIPFNNGVMDRYILTMSSSGSNSYSWQSIYRHTFTVKTTDLTALSDNDYAINICFNAVNAQAGDSTMDYLLWSDESYQYDSFDWILPVSGVIGQKLSGTVSTWHDAIRIAAGYNNLGTESEPNYVRCLFVYYFDATNNTVQKCPVVMPSNMYNYDCADFRSVVGDYLY